ncbi:hypothetical protein LJC00_01085 [Dysgonomonas sp. OttesenSCG-928-M03]|nr:hypothetical protein [Dysgonomonas sp. OttesenSCG-928-M03]
MRYLRIFIAQLIFFIIFSFIANAFEKPYIINFSKDRYGADNKNWSIGQDEKGIMYFGNDVGLLEFDGIGWTLNTMPNRLIVRSVSVLSHNTVFTGSYEEFGRWDRDVSGKLKYTSLSAGLDKSFFENDDFWKIWANEEYVYFQSFGSVFFYDYKTVERISSSRPILFLTKVRDEYWAQEMSNSILRLKGNKFEKIEGSEIFSNTEVRIILPYSTDQYLIGTATKGVYIYDGKSFKDWNPTLSRKFSAVDLNCGVLTSRGTYVFGTILDGIYEVDINGDIINHIATENTLQNNTVLSLFEDNLGNIWAGLDRGISYIQYLPKMSCYIDPIGNTGSTYGAVFWDDKLFIGTNQGVFYISKSDLNKSSTLSNMKLVPRTQGQVWSFIVIGERLFCCHNRGLKEIHKDLTLSESYGVMTGVYHAAKSKLKDRDVVLLSAYTSLKLIEEKSGAIYNLDRIKEPIIDTEVDHLENVWLEHFNKGVYRCRLTDNLQSIESYKYFGGDSGDGLPYKLKIFKVGGRIALLGDSKFYDYDDTADRIVSNDRLNECFKSVDDIRQIVHINGSLFWAMTGSAIYKFSYDGYNANIVESYDIGARRLSLINAYENISILNDSVNLVCLDNGFLIYNGGINTSDTLKSLDVPFIGSFQTSNTNGEVEYVNISEEGNISYNYNTVTIHFSAKNALASNYSFQYLLEGVDKNWSLPEKINKVSYERLPKGKYTFMVRTVDNLGNYSDTISCEFEILPPWYETVWAYLAYVFLILGALALTWTMILRRYRNIHLMKIRSRETIRLRRKNEQLEQVVQEKNAELLTQTSFVVQRNELILKIKDELSDFYHKQNNKSLAPLFSKVNTLLNENIDTEEDWKMFLINFEQKHTDFFKKLKDFYPQLTANDLRLCACLKLNLDSKEIAALMNVSVRAIENSRSRLRKKLNISPQQQLNEFFMQF